MSVSCLSVSLATHRTRIIYDPIHICMDKTMTFHDLSNMRFVNITLSFLVKFYFREYFMPCMKDNLKFLLAELCIRVTFKCVYIFRLLKLQSFHEFFWNFEATVCRHFKYWIACFCIIKLHAQSENNVHRSLSLNW